MTTKILIKNIFHMLAYAVGELKKPGIKELDNEEFDHIDDLFAEILNRWMARQIKRGLYRQYLEETDNLSVLRGRLNIVGTIRNIVANQRYLSCDFDELTVDNKFNQIIKSAMLFLLRNGEVQESRKIVLRRNIQQLSFVREIDLFRLDWSFLKSGKFNKFNESYRWPIHVCRLLIKCSLPTQQEGKDRFYFDFDENLPKLFEKFVLNYLRYHHSDHFNIDSGKIKWHLTSNPVCDVNRLPKMDSDIRIKSKNDQSTLIIDTKYYSKTLQTHWNIEKFHSHNLYQIFTYVLNEAGTGQNSKVSGMLLYAQTENERSLKDRFEIAGHIFFVKSIDLNQEFENIAAQLDNLLNIVTEHK